MCDQRAFAFDRRVLELNFIIDWRRDWPAPHLVSNVIRSVVHRLREAFRAVVIGTKSLVRRMKWGCVSVEAIAGREKSPTEKALKEYRRKLEHTFGSSKRIDDVVDGVGHWISGK